MEYDYRKKPVVVQAISVTIVLEIHKALEEGTTVECPTWLMSALVNNTIYAKPDGLRVNTLEGPAFTGDYTDVLIRGIKGEFYICKLDIFKATYEKV